MENKIFDQEFVDDIQGMNAELHKILRVLKTVVKRCAELEAEFIRENGHCKSEQSLVD